MSHEEEINNLVREMHAALVGNKDLGNPGIVKRLEVVENKQKDADRTMLKWAGVATGVSLVATAFKDKLFGGS